MRARQPLQDFAIAAGGYGLLAVLALELQRLGTGVVPFWPAAGFAFALVLRWPVRRYPAVLGGVAFGSFLVNLGQGYGAVAAGGVALVNALEPLLAVRILLRLRPGLTPLGSLRDITAFFSAVVIAALLSAAAGMAAFGPAAGYEGFGRAFLLWWSVDILGILATTPLLLSWWGQRVPPTPPLRENEGAERALLVASLLLGFLLVFFAWPRWFTSDASYLILAPLLWAGWRLPSRDSTLALAVVVLVTTGITAAGIGPFAPQGSTRPSLPLNAYLLFCAAATLAFSAAGALRAEAERELAHSEENYRRLLEQTNEGVWAMDAQNRTTYVNQVLLDMFGYEREQEMLGRTPIEFAPPEARLELAQALKRNEAGQSQHLELSFQRRDGRPLRLRLNASALFDHNGERIGGLAMVEDDSEREAFLAERDRLQAELRHAQRVEALGQLAGGVAHDFNNILTAIVGNAYLLERQVGEGEGAEELAALVAASQRAQRLVAQLLAFGRKQLLSFEEVDLVRLAHEATTMLRPGLGEGYTIEVAVGDPPPPAVRADGGQLQQVLVNLVVNARDAMPEGGPVSIQLDRDARGWARVRVLDRGPGIEPAVRPHVFEPFFTTKETGRGTGLGLSVAHGIVAQHGGEIRVDDAPGGGALLELRLPPHEPGGEA